MKTTLIFTGLVALVAAQKSGGGSPKPSGGKGEFNNVATSPERGLRCSIDSKGGSGGASGIFASIQNMMSWYVCHQDNWYCKEVLIATAPPSVGRALELPCLAAQCQLTSPVWIRSQVCSLFSA
jgi:hypothetical protein